MKVMESINLILNEVKKAVKGKDQIIFKVFAAILAQGHILIEDIPGVGKTTLALAFSKAMELEYHRMQFTPDVLPSDVVGFNILDNKRNFEYKPGAIQCNMFLADEINRTSSKTQSALLEVMEEGRVTVDGVTRKLPRPFTVIATQNPVGSAGTQMLPESQLDRFMIKLTMGYPELEQEVAILKERQGVNPMKEIKQVVTIQEILLMQSLVEKVFVDESVLYYIAYLAKATREHESLKLGLSPRGTLAVVNMTKARAFMKGREYALPEDVKAVFYDVAGHRILLGSRAKINRQTIEDIMEDIVSKTSEPKVG